MSRHGVAEYLFAPPPQPAIAVVDSTSMYPIHRIFCVGRNYADHAKEMGAEVDREAPFYFLKPATGFVPTHSVIPYPPGTSNYHYEMELVVALGARGYFVRAEDAPELIFGFAAGLDMTRRDLQLDARKKGRPWDIGKAFEQSAVVGPLVPRHVFGAIAEQRISLAVNGVVKQDARLSSLVWSIPQLVSHLSHYYHLGPGDLIMTGTPAGVGPVVPGDQLVGRIAGLPDLEVAIAAPEPAGAGPESRTARP